MTEASKAEAPPVPSHPLRWFPEFWELSHKRLRPQARLMGLSLVVGVIAGLGAIVFYAACQVVFHYALDVGAGYHPHAPAGEPPLFEDTQEPLRPWLLLLIPVARRTHQRLHRVHVRSGSRGTRYGFRHRRLPSSPGGDSSTCAADQDHRQRLDHRHGGFRRARRTDRPDRGRVWLLPRPLAAPERDGAAHPHGGGHGGRGGGHLSGTAGRGALRRRGAVPFARFRIGGHHSRGTCQRHGLLHVWSVFRLETPVYSAGLTGCGSFIPSAASSGQLHVPGSFSGGAGDVVYSQLLRPYLPFSSPAHAASFQAGHRRVLDGRGWRGPVFSFWAGAEGSCGAVLRIRLSPGCA